MILVAYWHGLRSSELTQLTPENIHGGKITVKRLKGSLPTTQPLIEHKEPLLNERESLLKFVKNYRPNQRIFPVDRRHFWRIVKKYAAAAGLDPKMAHPHMLKHSIALQTIHKMGIEHTRQWLGHRNISSTGEYLKVSDQAAGDAILKAIDEGL